ncbi:HdeA/HdeB family chaperone [Vibrio sp. SS-MA-C1-2]|uniref:HdeA/HdeB family chaperone n=1 Tax=Vibrio sp. SS-MA-C1-2 TaxID=2908646 RepID=UPI001F1C94FE|nr:HdeA/HdeB family chaperone [Vibrio sp. SS-MA-C1-2]UJF20056.1 HdeA/HdeB family chaperone [Vibrio sp. SS-MA-C1-2]
MKIVKFAIPALLALFSFNAAANTSEHDVSCEVFVAAEQSVQEVLLGYTHVYNKETDKIDLVPVNALESVSVEEVMHFCEENPDKDITGFAKHPNGKHHL